jgi:hypothetical protein
MPTPSFYLICFTHSFLFVLHSLVCAIFAVFLKHARPGMNLVRMALDTARSTDPAAPAPPRLLQKLWIRASHVKGVLREKKGTGADCELFAAHVLAKMELLLSLSSPPSMLPASLPSPSTHSMDLCDLTHPSSFLLSTVAESQPTPTPSASSASTPSAYASASAPQPAAVSSVRLKAGPLKPHSKWIRARALVQSMLQALKSVDNLKVFHCLCVCFAFVVSDSFDSFVFWFASHHSV